MKIHDTGIIPPKDESVEYFTKVESSAAYAPISFSEVNATAQLFANLIERRFDEIAKILLTYESFEVVEDETARTLDLLRNLVENEEYFRLRINEVTSFLPRNQPLYAFTCFVLIPSLMAHKVHFRIPHSMRDFFPKLFSILEITRLFPNVVVSDLTRLEFLRSRSALWVDPLTLESIPVTDAAIFTGSWVHAAQLRLVFDTRTLFIANGSGHNPVVVSNNADVTRAVDAVINLQLYNQGQDCSAPNSVLVHKSIFSEFHGELCKRLQEVKVGEYKDKTNRVGPISDPKDLVRIQSIFTENYQWLDPSTTGVIRSKKAIVEPTIICKPLKEGGNFTELFAPIVFLQEYETDASLRLYFESPHYAAHAMFITLFGTSLYIDSLIDREINGRILQTRETVLRNVHPHDFGIERGTQAYGGYGYETSSISINGKIMPCPTLPQRDIYEWLVKPILKKCSHNAFERIRFTNIEYKNVEKILRLASHEPHIHEANNPSDIYIDVHTLKATRDKRYIKLGKHDSYSLLTQPNVEYIASLQPADALLIRQLNTLLEKRTSMTSEDFKTFLYRIPTSPEMAEQEKMAHQLHFFKHVYQLLLGTNSGPRLTRFLLDVDIQTLRKLLDV